MGSAQSPDEREALRGTVLAQIYLAMLTARGTR